MSYFTRLGSFEVEWVFKVSDKWHREPFWKTTNKVQTLKMETEVVDFFATMFRANPKDYWGM